jgi:hypothetical protein
MMTMKVVGFDWDKGNRDKCQKHGVSLEEIEWLFEEDRLRFFPDEKHSYAEPRFQAIGQTYAWRYVFVVFTFRRREDGWFIRPLSARYMHKKEIGRYEKDNEEA